MVFETIIACVIVVALMVCRYEKKLEKAKHLNDSLMADNNDLITMGNKTIFDYNVLTSILQDHFEEDEIEELFAEKKEHLINLNDGKDEYDGRYF